MSTGDTPYQFWFDVDKSIIQPIVIYSNLNYSNQMEQSENFVSKSNFSHRHGLAKTFLFYTLHTGNATYQVLFNLNSLLIKMDEQFELVVCNLLKLYA